MENEQDRRTAWAAAVIFFLIVLALLTGCTRTVEKVVTEVRTDTVEKVVADTLRETHNDTIRETVVQNRVDTIREVQTRVVTLKESGDTIREVVKEHFYHYVHEKDSSDRYRSMVDSLEAKLRELERESKAVAEEKTVVKERRPWWSRWWVLAVIAAIASIALIGLRRMIRRLQNIKI